MKGTFIVFGAALAMLPVAAGAHHSFTAEYDGAKPMILAGTINKIDQQKRIRFLMHIRSSLLANVQPEPLKGLQPILLNPVRQSRSGGVFE